MQDEIDRFQKNDVWKLVEQPKGKKVVGAKWVFHNKLDKYVKVVKKQSKVSFQRVLTARSYILQRNLCICGSSRGNTDFTFICST